MYAILGLELVGTLLNVHLRLARPVSRNHWLFVVSFSAVAAVVMLVWAVWFVRYADIRPRSIRALLLALRGAREARGYDRTRDPAALQRAVALQRAAVATCPATHPLRYELLGALAAGLLLHHEATADEALLLEAVALLREAVDQTPETGRPRPRYGHVLAVALGQLYMQTGNRSALEEALAVERTAVDALAGTRDDSSEHLTNLADDLQSLYRATGTRAVLDEAISIRRVVLEASPPSHPHRALALRGLVGSLLELQRDTGDEAMLDEILALARTGLAETPLKGPERSLLEQHLVLALLSVHLAKHDRASLDEALRIQRQALAAPPTEAADRVLVLSLLAQLLAQRFEHYGDRAALDEARSLLDGVDDTDVAGKVVVRSTRALLARLGGRPDIVADELTEELNTYDRELKRLGQDLARRRDLAGETNGLLASIITSHVENGTTDLAMDVFEAERMWLHAPQLSPDSHHTQPIPVAWVATSGWETAVILSSDQRTFTSHTIQLTAPDLKVAVDGVMDAAADRDPERIRRTFDALSDIASRITQFFPATPRMLVVPLGLCALVPYTAATHPAGGRVIDHTALTIAPTLAWARAAHRPQPDGESIGVLHPGHDPTRQLMLDTDRHTIDSVPRLAVLDEPRAAEVLGHMQPDTSIMHVSCHGFYSRLDPFASNLELETPLTLRQVVEHGHAPWLVNLSACETAVPDLRAAEQLISFPTGFLLGGAAHVFATLWSIDNTYATEINREIYRHIADGTHPALALRRAVQHVRGQTTAHDASDGVSRSIAADQDQAIPLPWDHPFWWAGFTHHGSPW